MKGVLFVCGNWDDDGGRPSGYCDKLIRSFARSHSDYDVYNGGEFDTLEQDVVTKENLSQYAAIVWMANVPNDPAFPKLVGQIKKLAPHSMLVITKNNIDGKYTKLDLVGRALNAKANLLIEFKKNENVEITGTVIDPLGNCFLDESAEVYELARVLHLRLEYLSKMIRLPSYSVGEEQKAPFVDAGYLEYIQDTGAELHRFVHGVNQSRFLGNTSFRCTFGFPSFRDPVEELIYVSRRNIDKRDIGRDGFVACEPLQGDQNPVEFYGDKKPSVDTPIQLRLYRLYKNVNFMVHTHAYVKNAPFTQGAPVPCGSLQEVDKVWEIIPWADATNFAINLNGHGSIIMVRSWTHLSDFEFAQRPMLEQHDDYLDY